MTVTLIVMTSSCTGNAATPVATHEVPHTITDVTSSLKVMRSALWEVRAEWRDLGIELGITVGTCDVSTV